MKSAHISREPKLKAGSDLGLTLTAKALTMGSGWSGFPVVSRAKRKLPLNDASQKSASRKLNLTESKIRRHCPRRGHSRARKTLEVVLTRGMPFCWCGPNAAKL